MGIGDDEGRDRVDAALAGVDLARGDLVSVLGRGQQAADHLPVHAGLFADIGQHVGIADIAFANGSDNALMNRLRDAGLLYKIRAYAGWNTATNSAGFVIGTGLLSNRMSGDACDQLLTRRYLEDWGYQSNIRGQVGRSIYHFREEGVYSNLGNYEAGVVYRINSLMRQFAQTNLPPYPELEKLTVSLPWHRMFEARFTY